MSLVPLYFRDWWNDDDIFQRPSRLFDQQFGLGLRHQDLLNSFPQMPARSMLHNSYLRPWLSELQRQDSGSTIRKDKDRYQVMLDVQQFTPNEITVKANKENRSITIEGKHEEKQDEHGFVSRHFVRRYTVPADHDIDAVVSSLSSDGVLTITAPRKNQAITDGTERSVPITQTGPAKASASCSSGAK